MSDVPDLLMHVGSKYTLRQAVLEYESQGISKAIPIPPVNLVFGESRLFLEHPQAILEVTAAGVGLLDLAKELYAHGYLNTDAYELLMESTDEPVPPGMLDLAMGLDWVGDDDPTYHRDLIKKYGIQFHPGIFGYGYIQAIQWVCGKDDDGLPEKYNHLDGYITPVRVEYDEEEQDTFSFAAEKGQDDAE